MIKKKILKAFRKNKCNLQRNPDQAIGVII